jgi:hypothetical protein
VPCEGMYDLNRYRYCIRRIPLTASSLRIVSGNFAEKDSDEDDLAGRPWRSRVCVRVVGDIAERIMAIAGVAMIVCELLAPLYAPHALLPWLH